MFGRYAIKIVQDGRSGSVRYAERDRQYDFYWEFGGDDTVASISVPTPGQWSAALPWAADRCDEVLRRIAKEVCKKKCARCRPRFGDNSIDLVE
jgi:hypothetical protein